MPFAPKSVSTTSLTVILVKKDKETLRSFTTSPSKKGCIDGVLFSKPDYAAVGEPYVDSSKFKLRET